MQQLIASYLLSKKHCPIPGVGSLQFVQQPAVYQSADNKIIAPKTGIELLSEALSPKDLVAFIAAKKQISNWDADVELETFCKEIKNLSGTKEIELPHAGKFYIDEEGYLNFRAQPIFSDFFPTVEAQRVIHPNEQHQILVGDQEKTNTEMSEMLSAQTPAKTPKWWIAAIVFFVIAAAIIGYYYSNSTPQNVGGKATKVKVETSGPSYTVPK